MNNNTKPLQKLKAIVSHNVAFKYLNLTSNLCPRFMTWFWSPKVKYRLQDTLLGIYPFSSTLAQSLLAWNPSSKLKGDDILLHGKSNMTQIVGFLSPWDIPGIVKFIKRVSTRKKQYFIIIIFTDYKRLCYL